MKIRDGFVSNSSSSSFCIIGTAYTTDIEAIMKAEGVYFGHVTEIYEEGEDLTYGRGKGKFVTYYGDYKARCCGLEAEELLKCRTIEEARVYFVKHIKDKLGINIKLSHVGFHYGEAGNG